MHLVLAVIARNEAPRMLRLCASAAAAGVQHLVLVDTGSTDGTVAAVREAAAATRLELHVRVWSAPRFRFDAARNACLDEVERYARKRRMPAHRTYAVVLDADELLDGCLEHAVAALDPAPDGVALIVHAGAPGLELQTPVVKLLRLGAGWRYRGVVHEAPFLRSGRTPEVVLLPSPRVTSLFDSARNARPSAKYRADAALLLAELEALPRWDQDPRSVYYLAQSLRCAATAEATTAEDVDREGVALASEVYLYRAEMGPADEERWHARYWAGRLALAAGAPEHGRRLLWEAFAERPERLEPLAILAHEPEPHATRARSEARVRLAQPWVGGGLFVEPAAYDPASYAPSLTGE